MIRNQIVDLIENTFRREEVLYLACNEERAFFASEEHKKYDIWSCQKVTDALIYLLDNIYIRFGSRFGAWDGLRYFIVALPEPSI